MSASYHTSFLSRDVCVSLVLYGVAAVSLYGLGIAIYNVYLHPLARFPGPIPHAATRLPYVYQLAKGQLHNHIKELHDHYGPVIRLAPDELSFSDNAAWKDIYTGGNLNKGLPKHQVYHTVLGYESLFDAPDHSHSRMRKLFSKNFFSSLALATLEGRIQHYTDIFITRLKEQESSKSAVVNVQEWINHLTIDIAGDITLGENFGCLQNVAYHPWISMCTTHIHLTSLLMCARLYAPLDKVLIGLVPQKMRAINDNFLDAIKQRIEERVSKPEAVETKIDFVSTVSDSLGEDLSLEELQANCILLILAASETMSTALLSTVHLLCRSPWVVETLRKELQILGSEQNFAPAALARLPYLNAVLKESMRLCPPLTHGPARTVGPGTAHISGHAVPPGTSVGVSQYAANLSKHNFTNPEAFLPERWLHEGSEKGGKGDVLDVARPFSTGGRDCIGQALAMAEFRMMVARMVWSFDMTPQSKLRWTDQRAHMLWEKAPFYVQLRRAETVPSPRI